MIAVVDDEEPVRKAMVRLLQAAGYTARGFASGTEFLRSWLTDTPTALCWICRCRPFGYRGAASAAPRRSAFSVIIITANDRPDAREECMREGAVAYLCKPIEDCVLLNALKLAIGA